MHLVAIFLPSLPAVVVCSASASIKTLGVCFHFCCALHCVRRISDAVQCTHSLPKNAETRVDLLFCWFAGVLVPCATRCSFGMSYIYLFYLWFPIVLVLFIANINERFIQESGVRVTDAAKVVIDKIKAGKEFRYGVFFVKNETVIDLESTGMNLKFLKQYLILY